MVDGLRWKLVLIVDRCGPIEELLCLRSWLDDGRPSFWLSLYLIIFFNIQTIVSPLNLT